MSEVVISQKRAESGAGGRIKTGLKVLVWAAVAALALRFIIEDALHYFVIKPASYGPYWPRRAWLLTHVSGGMLALLLGLFQLWSGLGWKYLGVHRWTGRLYLFGVAVSAATAFYLSYFSLIGWTFGVALFTLSVVWVTASALAFAAIRRGLVEAHREWMLRSYVLTFAFVTFRFWIELPVFTEGTRLERFTTVAWLCWTVPLFITECLLQLKRIRREVR